MRIKAGSLALITGTACAGGMKQSAVVSEVGAMNVSSTFMDYIDFTGFIDPDIFRDIFDQGLIEALEATKILAVPGSEMGVGLPALIALGIYAWAQLRGMYHRNVLDPEPVEDDWLIELPDRSHRALGLRERASFALVGLGLIATPAWIGFLVYVPGHLIGWW